MIFGDDYAERRLQREKEDAEYRANEAERNWRRAKDKVKELENDLSNLRYEMDVVVNHAQEQQNRIDVLSVIPDVVNDDVVAALDIWFHQTKSPGLFSYLNHNLGAFREMTTILENDRKRQRPQ
jgi:chromosome segregation ATPase